MKTYQKRNIFWISLTILSGILKLILASSPCGDPCNGCESSDEGAEWNVTFEDSNNMNVGTQKSSLIMKLNGGRLVNEPGRFGKVLYCGGVDKCLDATIDQSTDSLPKCLKAPPTLCPNGFTISFWMKIQKRNTALFIMPIAGEFEVGLEIWYRNDYNEWRAAIREGTEELKVIAPAGDVNRWFQIGLVYDHAARRLRLYIDGVKKHEAEPKSEALFTGEDGTLKFFPTYGRTFLSGGAGMYYYLDDFVGVGEWSTDQKMMASFKNDYTMTRRLIQNEWQAMNNNMNNHERSS